MINKDQIIDFYEQNQKQIMKDIFFLPYGWRVTIQLSNDGRLFLANHQNSSSVGAKEIISFDCDGLNNRSSQDYEVNGKISFEMRYDDNKVEHYNNFVEMLNS